MSVGAPGCGQPLVDDLEREILADQAGSQSENVGVVMLAAVAGRGEV